MLSFHKQFPARGLKQYQRFHCISPPLFFHNQFPARGLKPFRKYRYSHIHFLPFHNQFPARGLKQILRITVVTMNATTFTTNSPQGD